MALSMDVAAFNKQHYEAMKSTNASLSAQLKEVSLDDVEVCLSK